MVHQHIITSGSQQKPIAIDVSYLSNNQQKPLVLFVHGFKGFKDWGHFNAIANYFAENNFVFVKFNFSHNGTSLQKPLEFDDLEAFGNNNYVFELNDLDAVLNTLLTVEQLKNEIDAEKVYLIGHSRGGAISIIKTSEDTRIKKLVTWAAVADIVNRNSAITIETWKKDGKNLDTIERITAEELEKELAKDSLVFDVRKPGEYEAEHVENVPSIPLDFINEKMNLFPKSVTFAIEKSTPT